MANCPHCGSRLGIHNKKGPNYQFIYVFISLILGIPIGGFGGVLVSTLVFFSEWDTIGFIAGAIMASHLFYLLIREATRSK